MLKIKRTWKTHSRILDKDPFSIEPPRKVIRALYDYTARKATEVSFAKGDFFHVIGRENDKAWYEVCNPAAGTRGFVPVSHFEEIGKTVKSERDSDGSGQISFTDLTTNSSTTRSSISELHSGSQPLFGIVQFDFAAERPDELEAKAGEAIIIIARSNHEWLVAKPIGRLGGPGLIPLSFIQLRDLKTGAVIKDVSEAVLRISCIPRVEDWKRAAADYKKSSIPLGKFSDGETQTMPSLSPSTENLQINNDVTYQAATDNSSTFPGSVANELTPLQTLESRTASIASKNKKDMSSEPTVVAAMVENYMIRDDQYWYLVRAVMSDGKHRNLCRYYEDFFNFQTKFLELFPNEAGRGDERRVIPYMPGPVDDVNELISSQRAMDLDVYLKEMCRLPARLLENELVKLFFLPLDGDVESPHPTSTMPEALPREPLSFSLPEKAPEKATNISIPESAPTTAGTTCKVKVRLGDETFALRVPSDISFEDFCGRLTNKLGECEHLSYRDTNANKVLPLNNVDDLRKACSQESGVLLFAERRRF